MDAGEPSYTTGDTLHTERAFTSNLGVFFAVFFLIIVLSYGSYVYRRSIRSQSSLPIISLDDTVHSDDDDECRGLDDDVLGTFPTILYSEVAMLLNGETNTATHADNCGSAGCSICLADYKPADVIRLLPECSHLFHVSCVDTWLRVHPTCPVCRNSPFPTQRI
ncbi:RING-H2 finger protein ATL70 [Lactuca sativa]|uniref:RING-H2 finger protein ATL70 n=1 Tax=Lactuca sativa TaxID=4236 RepID=UPI000CB08482|nr:RING-H2 finger protein ATL70 [Lactuca sativa]